MPITYNIYSTEHKKYIYTNCILVAIIPPHHTLTDDEVRMWFGIDEDHLYWHRAHRKIPVPRYVFDKCIVPDNKYFRVEVVHEDI